MQKFKAKITRTRSAFDGKRDFYTFESIEDDPLDIIVGMFYAPKDSYDINDIVEVSIDKS